MKQILQNLKNGETMLVDCPSPVVGPGQLKIRTLASVISPGTERMLLDFGNANMLGKARQQPEKVKLVLDKVRTDGLFPTVDAVKSKLDEPLRLGYSNAGIVVGIGAGVEGFSVGDRVASNGNHAETVCVPKNLCARIPDHVSDESAAFTTLAAIALQGVRLANLQLGESVVVIGLGIVGLLTVQLLRAQGCDVLGLDFSPSRIALAKEFGADVVNPKEVDDVIARAMRFSNGRGVDAVIIAAATKSSDPVHQAAMMCRKRGRIVLVGVTGLELSRNDFYDKELSFQVSCSYGPGRYDPKYEDAGYDYPFAFVRWTEQRNFEAVLKLMDSGMLRMGPLISHRMSMSEVPAAYKELISDKSACGIVLIYDSAEPDDAGNAKIVQLDASTPDAAEARLGFVGAGNYAGRVLIPAFRRTGAVLDTVVSSSGLSAVHNGKKYGFDKAASDARVIFEDDSISAVVIATRHNTHADLVVEALKSGKHVFVEKPLAISLDDLQRIDSTMSGRRQILMVGFNRRFSPLVRRIAQSLAQESSPVAFVMTVNAGSVPSDHWVQSLEIGGGRIVGEGCHFVDLLRHLADSPISAIDVVKAECTATKCPNSDVVTINLKFQNGSIGAIHYFANGHRSFPKERLEVFSSGKILQLDNFRKLRSWGWSGLGSVSLWRQDKGQNDCVAAFVDAIRKGDRSPIPFDQLLEVSRTSIEAQQAAI